MACPHLKARTSSKEAVQFVVEVPSHYIAGVLYRLDPEKYDVDAAPVAVANDPRSGSTEPVDTFHNAKNRMG